MFIRYKKPTRESLTTPEYQAMIEAKRNTYEPEAKIIVHRGIDNVERSSLSSTSSVFGRYIFDLMCGFKKVYTKKNNNNNNVILYLGYCNAQQSVHVHVRSRTCTHVCISFIRSK